MKPSAPNTLDEARRIKDPETRLLSVIAYLKKLDARRREALALRDSDIRLIKATPTQLAKLTDLSVSTIKLARRNPR